MSVKQFATSQQSQMLTEADAGAYLNISPKTLTAWRCTKRFEGPRYVKLGGAVRYPLRELDAFIERQMVSFNGGA